jgi:hypothetical protein
MAMLARITREPYAARPRPTSRASVARLSQSTVRATSSRLDFAAGVEDSAARIDHDNSSVASVVAFAELRAGARERQLDEALLHVPAMGHGTSACTARWPEAS